ncbi:lamin tail domain-containing protein [Arenibacter aquaticus]|uniref:Lamin tail domain-containing protein n=1 Tax=Arenibacter aquaticus TaxID=2489054 RepID=A0A430K6J2_9FLAO|nr:DUF5689 domain-containing protein [Arenibacter aquaticus]RTE54678.1 lamin tail domain-containing protein [Arenibacter aquaticus]
MGYYKDKCSGVCILLLGLIVLSACVKNKNFNAPAPDCYSVPSPNMSLNELKALYVDKTVQIQEDWIVEGCIVSSDRSGNFFGVIYIQDSPTNPTGGLQLEIDLRDAHLFYEMGSRILIKTKGLYLGKRIGMYTMGSAFNVFGNLSVGRLPAPNVKKHFVTPCNSGVVLEPLPTTLANLNDSMLGTLVRLEAVELVSDEVGLPYALKKEETIRTLVNCNGEELRLLNSGYSDFQGTPLPQGNGTITGVLVKDGKGYQLVVRDTTDLQFTEIRCEDVVDEFTSTKIFISELADPDNNTAARFVELYSAEDEPLSLKGWTLRRYTNSNTDVSSTIDLSGNVIEGQSTFVISPNANSFETVYGFAPDLGVSINGPADSNGDDNLELVDPFGAIIDVFGVVGEDGSGTNHEFEDGKALRHNDIKQANPVFTFSEWTIYNDSGDEGTINSPLNAPEDFTPGEH